MQTSMRTRQRGASHWPFIISLVLLLIAIFLWIDRKSEADKVAGEVEKLKKDVEVANGKIGEYDEWATKVTEVVGFPAPAKFAPAAKQFTDPEAVKKAISLEDAGSVFGKWKEASTVAITKEFYKGTQSNPPAAIEIAKISQAFRDKIAEIEAAKPGNAPVMPLDPDDAAAAAKYTADRAAYDAAFAKYKGLVDEAVKMKDFDAIKPVLGAVSLWSLDKLGEAVKWQFLAQPAVGTMTVEDLLKLPEPIFSKMKAEWLASVNGLKSQVDALTKEKAERDSTIEKTQAELAQSQTDRTADNAKLSKEAQDAKDALEKARIELTNASNLLAQAGDKAKVDAAAAKSRITALTNAIEANKELVADEIARDEKDGEVLDANNAQAICYINLGTADKVYAGLKFAAWSIGRGGFRVAKGEIVVTKVLDAHYSQARIASSVAPLGRLDSISNPFFRKDRPIRLFLAGDLRKYPKAIAVERLKRMNVIVEDTINTETDYVLVPAGTAVAPAGEKPAEGAAAPAETEFDKLQRMARSFGASLITENMISAFLDY